MGATPHTATGSRRIWQRTPLAAVHRGPIMPWRPLCLNLYIALVITTGSLAFVLATRTFVANPARLPIVFLIAAFGLGTMRLDVYGNWVSLTLVPMIAAGFLYGPAGAVITGVAGALGAATRDRSPRRKILFNVGVFALASEASAAASLISAFHSGSVIALVCYGLVAAFSVYVINAALICLVIALDSGHNPFAVWRERFRWLLPQILLMGQVALGLAVAYRANGAYELVIFGLPVLGLQLASKQYLAHTTRSVTDLRARNAELQQLMESLKNANETVHTTYRGTLEALVTALDVRDNEVQGHSARVCVYSQVVAETMGIAPNSDQWEAIRQGALLHDVGKIGVADSVLRKPGSLDEYEWSEMRRHAEIGFDILKDMDFLRPAAVLVLAHHERFDGTGYPHGLCAAQIPLGARIFAVVDTFDAITTDRPYRRAAPPEAAVAEIRRCAGTQFDPAVVVAFEGVWRELWSLRGDTTRSAA